LHIAYLRNGKLQHGKPGVWFFSLDAESSLAVIGARLGVRLPYFRASMQMTRRGDLIDYVSDRWSIHGAPASFESAYRGVGAASTAHPVRSNIF
jgi:uncharacterized protein YqjF (DUF2071 family)